MARDYVPTRLGRVHVTTDGAGAPLVLLAQAGRSGRMFAGLIPLLAPHFKVLALDMPGFGNSDPLPTGTTIEQLAECVGEVIRGLGFRSAHVYGLHSGNKIGTALAANRPDLVDRLILAGQSHSIIPDQAQRSAAIHRIIQSSANEPTLDEIQSLDSTSALYSANFNYDLGADLTRIRVPTLILEIATPQEDVLIGRQGPKVQALVPEAALLTIEDPGTGIVTLESRPEDLAAAIVGFLVPARTRGGKKD